MVKPDEDLYSRQIFAIGAEAMRRLAEASVLISGMGGLGVEIAKDVILAGVQKVTIHDQTLASMDDLGSQFYLTEAAIGQNRALASLPSLINLNEYVSVSAYTDDLTLSFLSNFHCVVLTEARPENQILEINSFCRSHGIKFILTQVRGLFGFLFNDFGPDFVVRDPQVETSSRFLISSKSFITNDSMGIVTVDSQDTHNLAEGSHVRFENVGGMTEVNNREFVVSVIDSTQFSIGDTSEFHPYRAEYGGGYGVEVIVPQRLTFSSLEEALKDPDVIVIDWLTPGRERQVFLAFWTLIRLQQLESVWTVQDFCDMAKQVTNDFGWTDAIDVGLMEEFVRQNAVIAPMAAVFGGLAAQEIMKSVSLKYVPFQGFLAGNWLESLPKQPIVVELKGDRYDPYRLIFGNAQVDAIFGLRYFLVGAGAIGCEMLKNWALMGLGINGGGVVTDIDAIERSNLNRQFLFRNNDIGALKSVTAAAAVSQMNPDFRIEAHSNRVGRQAETIYTDSFYRGLSGICNAVDNVEARQYNNSKCEEYQKPLLESGTMGPRAHFEAYVPHVTASYTYLGSRGKSIPQCTLHSFPTNIAHCATWARDQFAGLFTRAPTEANKYLSQHDYAKTTWRQDQGALLSNLRIIQKVLLIDRPHNFDDCVRWARLQFEELFVNRLRDLLQVFPPDKVDETGNLFWRGERRLPDILIYNPGDQIHAAFVTGAARLRAEMFGIPVEPEAAVRAASVEIPPWVPSGGHVRVSDNEPDKTETTRPDKAEAQEILKRLKKVRREIGELRLNIVEFEKDDPSNGHIDFIAAAANLRALNYRIKTESTLEIKRIAARLAPALATTTAAICGFVCLEIFKVHSIVPKPLEDFRSGQINLAEPSINLWENKPCHIRTCTGNGRVFSQWDKWTIEGDLSVEEFRLACKRELGLELSALMVGSIYVYPSIQKATESTLDGIRITEIWTTEAKQLLVEGNNSVRLNAFFNDNDGREIVTPPIYLKYK